MPKKKMAATPVTPDLKFKDKVDSIINRAFDGEHHVREVIWIRPGAVRVKLFETRLSTFDFNTLTVLVVSAHDVCARIEVQSVSGGRLELFISNRYRSTEDNRSGAVLVGCHPTLYRHMQAIRDGSSDAYQELYTEMKVGSS